MVCYSDYDITNRYRFNDNPQTVANGIPTLTRVGGTGGSRLADALRFIKDQIFTSQYNERPGVPNYIVSLIDSPSNDFNNVQQVAQELKTNGVKIVPVGISSSNPQASETDIRALADSPPRTGMNYWYIDVTDLTTSRQAVGRQVCSAQQ